MTTPFLASLDAEILRLEAVIEALPEGKQLAELRRVRTLYAGNDAPRQSVAQYVGPAIPSRPGRRMAPERSRAIEFAKSHLMGQATPIRTVALLAAMQAHGIEIGGTDPVNSLSALLSTSSLFVAHGRSGWTAKPEIYASRMIDVSDAPQEN